MILENDDKYFSLIALQYYGNKYKDENLELFNYEDKCDK